VTTPTFVKLSAVHSAFHDLFSSLRGRVFDPMHMELTGIARLCPSYDRFDGGLEMVGEVLPCFSESEAIEIARGWHSFGLIHLARRTRGNIYQYFFDLDGPEAYPDGFGDFLSRSGIGFCTTISFDDCILHHHDDEYDRGEWLARFLLLMTEALEVSVCGYASDDDYAVNHEPLDPQRVMQRLRQGDFARFRFPHFHAIGTDLLDAAQLQKILRQYPLKYKRASYLMSLSGYHVIKMLC